MVIILVNRNLPWELEFYPSSFMVIISVRLIYSPFFLDNSLPLCRYLIKNSDQADYALYITNLFRLGPK